MTLVKCNTCKHNGLGWCQHPQAIQHPDAFWDRDSEEDAHGRPWCHSDRIEEPSNEDHKRDH